ncbi:hypothetical protein UlMin_009574 [Ulmus minor]
MGALTSNRKRGDEFRNLNHAYPSLNSPNFQTSKKPRFSFMQKSPERSVLSSNSAVARVSRYPEAKPPLPRIHAPCSTRKFGSITSSRNRDWSPKTCGSSQKEAGDMGNILSSKLKEAKSLAFGALRFWKKEKEVIELDDEVEDGKASDDSSIEVVEVIEDDGQERTPEANGVVPSLQNVAGSSIEPAQKMFGSLSINREIDVSDVSAYKKLLEEAERRNSKLRQIDFDIKLAEKRWSGFQALRPAKKPVDNVPQEPFIPLTKEELMEVEQAFRSNWKKVLVTHQSSNLEITAEMLQCLRPAAWLNDEVINLYLELLKEREKRDPKKYLKCHFFNTFFYKKLIGGSGYDYKSVRRWTTQKKLGYSLIDCDKIFVPVHKEIHWCLAVINKKDQKFQYLDSLKGGDRQVMKVLPRYYVDEVKDKSGREIDVSSWEHEFVQDLPEQKNGFDCGMFMIKYADFYSRGLGLCFKQEHMPYFRLRTAKEILKLRAE